MRYNCIYRVTNTVNGKTYIGKHETDDLDDGYLGSGTLLKRAIRCHGRDAFSKEILFCYDNVAEMDAKEAEIVTEEYVRSTENYNLCPGGRGGFGYINATFDPLSEREQRRRARIRQTNKVLFPQGGPNHTAESLAKVSATLKKKFAEHGHHWSGREHKEESKAKIGRANSVAQSGQRNSQFGTAWICHQSETPRKIKVDEIASYIARGWQRGRSYKFGRE
jgi:hypothetical protein